MQVVMIGEPLVKLVVKGQVWLVLELATVVRATTLHNLIMHSTRYWLYPGISSGCVCWVTRG